MRPLLVGLLLGLVLGTQLSLHIWLAGSYFFGDEGYYLTESDLVSRGWVMYRDFFDNHSPGIAYLGSMAFGIFGRDFLTGRLLSALAQTGISLMVFGLAWRMLGSKAGLVAAAYYASLELVTGGFWFITEPFLALFITASAWLAWEHFSRRKQSLLFLSGILAGIAILFKQPGIYFAVFLVAYSVHRRADKKDIALLVVGMLLPIFLAGAFFLANGALWDAVYGTTTFNIAVKGLRDADLRFQFYDELLALVPFYALVLLAAKKAWKGDAAAIFILGWAVSAGLDAFPRYVGYHLMAAFPAMAIFLGSLVQDLRLDWNFKDNSKANLFRIGLAYGLAILAVSSVASVAIGGQYAPFPGWLNEVPSVLSTECDVSSGIFGFPGFPYFFANATPATYYLEFSPWLVNPEIEQRTIAELEKNKPDCVLYITSEVAYIRSSEITPELSGYLESHYDAGTSLGPVLLRKRIAN